MKKKIIVGIPRAFLYYRNYILWKNFFEGLGCTLILSPMTNKDIIEESILENVGSTLIESVTTEEIRSEKISTDEYFRRMYRL